MFGFIINMLLARRNMKAFVKLAYQSDVKEPSGYSGRSLPNQPWIFEADIVAYDLTKGMLDYLNRTRHHTGLCFNELPETEARIRRRDMPTPCRRFEVYFNALPLGHIEFTAGLDLLLYDSHPDKKGNPIRIQDLDRLLQLSYKFENLEILDIHTTKSLLIELFYLMLPASDPASSRTKARSMAVEIMMDYLWERQNDKIFNLDGHRTMTVISGLVEGNAGIYLDVTKTQLDIKQ